MSEISEAAKAKVSYEPKPSDEALMRAADMLRGMQRSHEVEVAVATFLQEVSDAAKVLESKLPEPFTLKAFILPDPVDPLQECLRETYGAAAPEFVAAMREALAKRGLKIVEASDA